MAEMLLLYITYEGLKQKFLYNFTILFFCCTLPMRDWNIKRIFASSSFPSSLYITYEGLKLFRKIAYRSNWHVVHYLWGIETKYSWIFFCLKILLYITYEGLKRLELQNNFLKIKKVVHYLWGIETLYTANFLKSKVLFVVHYL